jgi:N-acyl-D-amino-acid deacylase
MILLRHALRIAVGVPSAESRLCMRTFDLLVRDAEVLPGDGPGFRADVAVMGERIVAVQPDLPRDGAREVIEGRGLLLCPGFIDLHAHSALEPFRDPRLLPKIAQGFTTELVNPDGLSPAPVEPERVDERRVYLQPIEGPGPERWTWGSVDDYLVALTGTGPATTLVPSVGHNAVRDHVMAGEARPATAGELVSMREQVRRGLDAGARSLSFGLVYLPGMFSGRAELTTLALEAARVGAPLAVHVRNEGSGVLEAVEEMIEVARRSGAPLHLSHLKVIGDPHLLEPLLERVDAARRELDLTFDQYPYGAGTSLLSGILPPWCQEGGTRSMLERLRDPGDRRRVVRDIARGLPGWENLMGTLGADAFTVVHAAPPREADVGRTLADIAAERGTDPVVGALDLLAECELDVTSIEHYAEESTVREIFRHPAHLVGTDGIFSTRPHPRLYGTAARVLGRYALRERLVAPGEAVARMTWRSAQRLGLSDRGAVRPGLRADLVVLDPARFVDSATYDDPARFPQGVVRVLVAGRAVWADGRPTEERPGTVWRDPIGSP